MKKVNYGFTEQERKRAWLVIIWFFIVILIFVVFLANEVRGETFETTYEINSSLNVTNATIKLNIMGYIYELDNYNFNSTQQTNVTLSIEKQVDYTNYTGNVSLECDCPETTGITNESMDDIDDRIRDEFSKGITNMQTKVTEEINFHIKPEQAKFDVLEIQLQSCKENMTKAQVDKFKAEVQQEKWYFESEDCEEGRTMLLWMNLGLLFLLLGSIFIQLRGGFGGFKPKLNL